MQDALEFVESHPDNQCLYLDRELSFEDQVIRITMSNTGIHHEDIESGIYENDEHRERVLEYIKKCRENKSLHRLNFVEAKNLTIEEIVNKIKSWRYPQDKTRPALVIYDYLNVGKKGNRADPWLDLSDQISELKIIAKEFNMILITAMQTNRSGDARNQNNNSGTSNSIGASYKAVEDSNHSMFFQQKTDEEIAADERIGLEACRERWSELIDTGNPDAFQFGTHKIAIKSQYYVNITLCRGKLIEKGDIFDVIAHQNRNPHPSHTSSNSPNRTSEQDNGQTSNNQQPAEPEDQEELF